MASQRIAVSQPARHGWLTAVLCSEPVLRASCVPLDLTAALLLRLGDLTRWLERKREELSNS